MIAANHSMMGGGGLPFTPIYGICSDGYSYCALPRSVNSSYGAYEIDMTVDSTSYSNLHLLGGHGDDVGNHFLFHYEGNGAHYCFGFYVDSLKLEPKHRHKYKVERDLSGGRLEIDGVENDGGRIIAPNAYNDSRFLIFRANTNSTSLQPKASESPTGITIHNLKVWYGDEQVANLIPCREKSTGEVCFYNLIDKTFVRNIAGAGSALLEVMEN